MTRPARRKSIPVKAQLHAALYQLGFEPHEVDLDHDPALGLRVYDEATQDTIPPANDPRYLVWRPKAEHKLKTTGRKGESKLSVDGNGDVSRIAKVERLLKKQETKETPSQWPTRKLESRPFPKHHRPLRSAR
jgi:hypothetical protein